MASSNEYAHFHRLAPDLLEVRLKAGVHIDRICVAKVMEERLRLCCKEPLCVLVLVSRDAELDIAVLGMDHYQVNDSAEGLRAVSICAPTLMVETMARLYAAYFPPMFRFEVFNEEAEARKWIEERVAESRRAGQKA